MKKLTAALLVVLFAAASPAGATTYTWSGLTGNWSDVTATGWNSGAAYPASADDCATIATALSSNPVVTIDVTNAKVNSLTLTGNASNFWTIASSNASTNKLTFDCGTATATLTLLSTAGNNIISAPVVLSGKQLNVYVPSGTLTFTGAITGNQQFEVQSGLVILQGTYASTSRLQTVGGVCRFDGASAFPTATWAETSAGLEFTGNYPTFTGPVGQTSGGISYSYSSYIGAYGSAVSINHYGDQRSLTWGASGTNVTANTLIFGTTYANNVIQWKNSLALGGNMKLGANYGLGAMPTGDVQGNLTDCGSTVGGLYKVGDGTLILSGANTYTGPTIMDGGKNAAGWYSALRINSANALSGGVLSFGNFITVTGTVGGVLEGSSSFSSFTRTVGPGAGQVYWYNRNDNWGGFSAYGSDFTVNLNGNATPDTMVWAGDCATNFFTTPGQRLVFGTPFANKTVLFKNPIQLTGSAVAGGRTVTVNKGVGTTPEVDLQGGLSEFTGGAGSLTKDGAGTLAVSGNSSYTGTTTVSAGALLVNGTHTNGGNYSVSAGATLGGSGIVNLASAKTITLTAGVDGAHLTMIAPGSGQPNSYGTFSVNKNVTFVNNSGLGIDISPTASDQLSVTGNLSLGSVGTTDNLTLAGSLAGGLPTYTLASFTGTLTGTFNSVFYNGVQVANPTSASGNIAGYQLVYGASNIQLVAVAVPEPATFALFGTGALFAFGVYRRRRVK